MPKLLSVIIPSLDGTVPESVTRQVANADDIELVVIRGVSPVGRARNEGLARATGEYIAWVDSDDEVSDDWLAEIRAALADGPDVVTFDFVLEGWGYSGNSSWAIEDGEITAERLCRAAYRGLGRLCVLWLYVTRRTLWQPLRFNDTIDMHEDFILQPKVLEQAMSCRYLRRPLYRYHYRASSITHTQDAQRNASAITAWAERLRDCPPDCLSACRCGLAINAYWICDSAAIGISLGDPDLAEENARRCRKMIRQHLGVEIWELLFRCEVGFRERLVWAARFLCAALDFWTIQRIRLRRRQRTA